MTKTNKNIIWIALLGVLVWFIYVERGILPPFILAIIFAYIFDPVLSLFQKRFKVPRIVSVLCIYIAILILLSIAFSYVGRQLIYEANQFSSGDKSRDFFDSDQVKLLPEWQIGNRSFGFQTFASELQTILSHTAANIQNNIWPYFTVAASQIINLLTFLIATFYFLKDGDKLIARIRQFVSNQYFSDFDVISGRINKVLGDYLRGEVILVLIMTTLTWVALSILGVKFALVLAILTGFLELIPYLGPLVATTLAALSVFITGRNNFDFDVITLSIIVISLFFIFRQLEDYFVIPQVLGRVTRLHPMVILFSVLAGGHLAGALGFILAVPIVASLRVLAPFMRKYLD